MGMSTYELWYYIMVVSFVAAGVFLALAIVFFFRAHISSTIAVLSGRAQKRDIERIRTEIGQDGHERFHYFEGEENRAGTMGGSAGFGRHAPVVQDHLKPDGFVTGEQRTGKLALEDLRADIPSSGGLETSILSATTHRQGLSPDPQVSDPAGGFRIVSAETVIHAEDIIGDASEVGGLNQSKGRG
jgi:hypothetical protein